MLLAILELHINIHEFKRGEKSKQTTKPRLVGLCPGTWGQLGAGVTQRCSTAEGRLYVHVSNSGWMHSHFKFAIWYIRFLPKAKILWFLLKSNPTCPKSKDVCDSWVREEKISVAWGTTTTNQEEIWRKIYPRLAELPSGLPAAKANRQDPRCHLRSFFLLPSFII